MQKFMAQISLPNPIDSKSVPLRVNNFVSSFRSRLLATTMIASHGNGSSLDYELFKKTFNDISKPTVYIGSTGLEAPYSDSIPVNSSMKTGEVSVNSQKMSSLTKKLIVFGVVSGFTNIVFIGQLV